VIKFVSDLPQVITATTAPKETVEKQKIIFVSTWLFPNFRLHTALDFVIAGFLNQ
jgi:hypothetical protein